MSSHARQRLTIAESRQVRVCVFKKQITMNKRANEYVVTLIAVVDHAQQNGNAYYLWTGNGVDMR